MLRVFENSVLRRIFGSKKDKVTWEFRKLHNEELINLYSSPTVEQVIKLRRMRWVIVRLSLEPVNIFDNSAHNY
jgi:hypothetical protein